MTSNTFFDGLIKFGLIKFLRVFQGNWVITLITLNSNIDIKFKKNSFNHLTKTIDKFADF